MRTDRRLRQPLLGLTCVGVVILLAAACSGSPTSPAMADLRLAGAQMLLEGTVINDTTMAVGHASGVPIRFEATLMGPDGPAPGQDVLVRYQRPGGMMGGSGEFRLYDDGTHGDVYPGDGVYCFEDIALQYGCNARGMGPGAYHYDFFGIDHDGRQSNHMGITVTLE